MKFRLLYLILLLLPFLSCQDNTASINASKKKDEARKAAVFTTLERTWHFDARPLNAQTQAASQNWSEWRLFLTELRQKPKSSIIAYQKKSKALTLKVAALPNNMPAIYNKPEVKSRITALTTTVRALDLYMNLDDIPADKVVASINEINLTLSSLEAQMEEIIERGNVKMERGESEMIKMLDTTRAIPNVKK